MTGSIKNKHKWRVKILNAVLLVGFALVVLAPIYIVLNISFKTNQEYLYSNLLALPVKFNMENYKIAIEKGKMILGFKNTLILISTSIVGSIIFGSMVAYIIGRFEFRMKKTLTFAFLISTIIPSVTTQVATFSIIKDLHLYNTIYAGIMLYLATDVIQIYVFLQFIDKIPYSLDESAAIDGASYFRIYAQIILPLLKPAMATLAILKAVNVYNDMLIPYLYMPSNTLKTVTTSLMSFSADQTTQWNLMAAGIIAVMFPTLIIFIFFQKHIISGIGDGAVK